MDRFYYYENNDESVFTFTAEEGSSLILTLGGETESGYDYVIVDGVAYDGDLSGIVFTSDSNVLTFSIDSDGSYTAGAITWSVLSNILISFIGQSHNLTNCFSIFALFI